MRTHSIASRTPGVGGRLISAQECQGRPVSWALLYGMPDAPAET
jgi:hypothetical protein